MNELLGGGDDDHGNDGDGDGDGDGDDDDCDRDGRVDKKGESLSPPQGGRLPGVKKKKASKKAQKEKNAWNVPSYNPQLPKSSFTKSRNTCSSSCFWDFWKW